MNLLGYQLAKRGLEQGGRQSYGGGPSYSRGYSERENELYYIMYYINSLERIKYNHEYVIEIPLPKKGIFKRISNKIKGIKEPTTKRLKLIIIPGAEGGYDARIGDEYLHFSISMYKIKYIERLRFEGDENGDGIVYSEEINYYGYSQHVRDSDHSVSNMITIRNVDRKIPKFTQDQEMIQDN